IFILAATFSTILLVHPVQFGYAQLDMKAGDDNNSNTNMQTLTDSSSSNLPNLIVSPSLTSMYRDTTGNLHIVGEIYNNFTFPIQFIQIIATLYDSNNQALSVGNA